MATRAVAQGRQLLTALQHVGAVVGGLETHSRQSGAPSHHGGAQCKHPQGQTRGLLPASAPTLLDAGLCGMGFDYRLGHGHGRGFGRGQRMQSRTHHFWRERRVAKAYAGGIKNSVGNGRRAGHRGRLARTQGHIVARARHLHHLNDGHLAEIQNGIAAPVLADNTPIFVIRLNFL